VKRFYIAGSMREAGAAVRATLSWDKKGGRKAGSGLGKPD